MISDRDSLRGHRPQLQRTSLICPFSRAGNGSVTFFARANSLYSVSQKRFCLRFFGASAQHRASTPNRRASAAVRCRSQKKGKSAELAHRKGINHETIKRSSTTRLFGWQRCLRWYFCRKLNRVTGAPMFPQPKEHPPPAISTSWIKADGQP